MTSSKKIRSYAFSDDFNDALEELIRPERAMQMPGKGNDNKKTVWLETIASWFLMQGLKGKVYKGQLATARTPDEQFKLFLKYSRAMRKVEGYGILPNKYVFGPDEFAIYKAIAEHPPTDKTSK